MEIKGYRTIAPSKSGYKYAINDLEKLIDLLSCYYELTYFEYSKVMKLFKDEEEILLDTTPKIYKLLLEAKKDELFEQVEKVLGLFLEEEKE